MATHSIILAWRIPWTEEPGGQQSMGTQRVRQDWPTNFTFFCSSRSLTLFYDLVFNIHKPKTLSRKTILIVLYCSFFFYSILLISLVSCFLSKILTSLLFLWQTRSREQSPSGISAPCRQVCTSVWLLTPLGPAPVFWISRSFLVSMWNSGVHSVSEMPRSSLNQGMKSFA